MPDTIFEDASAREARSPPYHMKGCPSWAKVSEGFEIVMVPLGRCKATERTHEICKWFVESISPLCLQHLHAHHRHYPPAAEQRWCSDENPHC